MPSPRTSARSAGMIAKGNPHGDGAKLARYLVTGQRGELAELAELRGFEAGDLVTAFRHEEFRARGTNATAGFFHCYIRLAPGERLRRQQWIEVVGARAERTLGFTGQPRAMSFHIDKATGDRHLHLAWSRIASRADGRLYAIDPGLYKLKLKKLSRALEQEFGLRIVSNNRAPDAKTRAAARNEFEEARRLDTDLKQIRNTIHDCLHRAENGAAFKAALDAAGLMLASGDRRDCFVAVDQAGGHHALNKKLTGLTLAELRQRLSDLDRSLLPDVAAAKTRQHQRQVEQAAPKVRQPSRNFSCASAAAAEPPQKAVETPKAATASEVPRKSQSASTAPQSAQQPLQEGVGAPALFRRLARVLTVRGLWCVIQARVPQRRRFAISCRSPPVADVG
jgi:hypothetical protein